MSGCWEASLKKSWIHAEKKFEIAERRAKTGQKVSFDLRLEFPIFHNYSQLIYLSCQYSRQLGWEENCWAKKGAVTARVPSFWFAQFFPQFSWFSQLSVLLFSAGNKVISVILLWSLWKCQNFLVSLLLSYQKISKVELIDLEADAQFWINFHAFWLMIWKFSFENKGSSAKLLQFQKQGHLAFKKGAASFVNWFYYSENSTLVMRNAMSLKIHNRRGRRLIWTHYYK